MSRRHLNIFTLSALLFSVAILPATRAEADVVYTYTGLNWFDYNDNGYGWGGDPSVPSPSDHLTISMEFAQALPANMANTPLSPEAWFISDGVYGYSSATFAEYGLGHFGVSVATNHNANIASWFIVAQPYPHTAVYSDSAVTGDTSYNYYELGLSIPNEPSFDVSTAQQLGSWSSSIESSVPEASGCFTISAFIFSAWFYNISFYF